MAELQVQYIDPQELKPFADNPRHHSERNIQDIQRSIKKFGFTNPILVRQEDNMVVAGHGRLQSAQELGLEEVPVIYLDFSENDAKLYAITDNRTAETSEWDLVALDELVQSLELGEGELPDTGFYADELEEILAEVQEDVDLYADKDADAVPEEVEPITQEGDLWILGAHRVLCGDATRAEDVERLMDGQRADMVFTDPPYNVGIDYGENMDDEKESAKYIAWSEKWFKCVQSFSERVVFTPGVVNLWFWYGIEKPKCLSIWVKRNQQSRNTAQGWNAYEPVLVYGKTKVPYDVWDEPVNTSEKLDHPVPKTVKAWQEILESVTEANFIVLDPFLGSGTTLVACEKTGRECNGLEISPHYCDVIVQRYADFVESTQDITLVRDGQELSYESVNQP